MSRTKFLSSYEVYRQIIVCSAHMFKFIWQHGLAHILEYKWASALFFLGLPIGYRQDGGSYVVSQGTSS